jgi:hypothetical protein
MDMKKVVALVLALVLALTAVVALAAPSPQGPGGKVEPAPAGGGTTGDVTPADDKADEEVVDEKAAEEAKELAKTAEVVETVGKDSDYSATVKESLKEAADKGDVLDALPEEIQEELKEEGLTAVNEMVTVKFPADSKNLTFKMKFQTPYKAGQTVAVLIAVPGKDGNVEWVSVNGIATGDGEVVFIFDEATYDKVAGQEVVVVPASEPVK